MVDNEKMMESLRIFGILLRKCWLVSRRHWLKTLLGQILLPTGFVVCAWIIFESAAHAPDRFETDTHYEMVSSEKLIDDFLYAYSEGILVVYTPNSTFVDELMMRVHKCFKNKTGEYTVSYFNQDGSSENVHCIVMQKFHTEADIVDFYRKNSTTFSGISVIFDQSVDNSTKHLHFKLQVKSLPDNKLYYPFLKPSVNYLRNSPFVQVQMCLSESFVNIKSSESVPQTFIQQGPYPAHVEKPPAVSTTPFSHFLLTVGLMIPAFIETLKAINEKFVGINVLMSMNGIPSALNLLSWLISGLLLSSVVGVISTFLMSFSYDESVLAFANDSNPYIIFLVLVFHMAHTIAFDLHLSAYISKALIALPVISLINVFAIVMHIYVFEGNLFVAPCVGIIFPVILLYQATNEIFSHERIAEDLQWRNFFGNENLMIGIEKSIGMILVLSAIGMVFHFILAIYVHAINPGKYGVGHHLLFFVMSENNQEKDTNIKNLVYNNVEDKYFEPTSATVYSTGIQIRNLKKFYNCGLFKREKVHALAGVSIDFYKGQITSLLGHNGAGKSTLMSILTRMTSATDGSIFINSKNLKGNACEILKDVGLCAQENMHFASLTVTEQLEFFAMVKRKDESRSAIKENIENLIKNFKLFTVKDALPNDLSGDQKRKLSLAMALVGDPSTLILDEPTSGLEPHSKRTVWDVLLPGFVRDYMNTLEHIGIKKIKDQKTILISTHDMDEADILGDRIAILHNGQIKSYGTPLFLKKMIGGQKSIEVTLSIERWSDVNRILKELHHEAAIVKEESGEIILSVPTLTLSQWLRTLEGKKKNLDISGYNLAHVSLERVFLKLTEENANSRKSHCSVTSDEAKLKGLAQHLQSARALFVKKLSYTLKDTNIILIQTLLVMITLLVVVIVRMTPEEEDQPTLPMNLNMYDSPRTLYANFNTTLGDQYDSVSRNLGGISESTANNLDDELMRWAKSNLAGYVKHMIAAAEFSRTANGTYANAFYSERATHSLPISVNLLWNAIIRNILGPDYSISLSSQQLPNVDLQSNPLWFMSLSVLTTGAFMILFSFVIAIFVVHPSQERSQGTKQLQKMTGVSGFVYWGTMFLFDLMVYAFFVLLLIVGSVGADRWIRLYLYDTEEIMVIVLLLMLFAVNMLPLIYAFSFIETKTENLVKLLTFASIVVVLFAVPCIFYHFIFALLGGGDEFVVLDSMLTIFFLLPHVSLIKGHLVVYWIAMITARCKRLPNDFYDTVCRDEPNWDDCCELNCYDGKCLTPTPYFEEGLISVKKSVTYLCATPILYFGLLAALEYRLFSRMMTKFKRHEAAESNGDETVQREKAMILQQIQNLSSNNQKSTKHTDNFSNRLANRGILVYELRKNYKKVRAVVDVSFGVEQGECFGLFGVNQAGKSTLLKMMTGEEIPDHGTIYVGDENSKHNKKSVGYCPQYDETLKCLNAYDHLRLFARLRGIPDNQLENEVQAWIDRLNLNACASLPSSTYSVGNKQRLNVAIALVGNPKLILLDEPATRMDPGARRSLWNTIKSCQKAGQTFLLASHNMDECIAVCNRMVVMTDGKLTCNGRPKELKQRFGDGYDVQIRMNPSKISSQLDQVKKDMRLLLHCMLVRENSGYLMYSVAGPGTTWKKVYEVMNKIKSKYDCIDDFLVIVRLSN